MKTLQNNFTTKEWCSKHLRDIPNQEVDNVAMVWRAAMYQNEVKKKGN